MFGQLILSFVFSESTKMMIFIFLILVLSIFTAYFSIFIHRYFYIIKNMDFVKQVYPDFGLPKSERYKRPIKNKGKKNRKKKR